MTSETPRWVRPVLAALAATAAAVYGWNLNSAALHPFYGPAVKSMSVSWRAWWFGSFDPGGAITLDKLPGAFQLQALPARLFGFHPWAVLLPQVLAAVLAVLALYRLVNRWQGPVAGLAAAAALACTPIVAALARTQIADALLVLVLILAADAWYRAVLTGRLLPLLVCGGIVGLGFGVKMAQAWALLPVFALLYLVAAPPPLARRFGHVAAAGGVTVLASSPWIATMLLVPAADRPYVDGSLDNSPLAMVFGYNALSRFGLADAESVAYGMRGISAGWKTMLTGPVATQVGWLYPLALAGLVAGLLWRRRAGRTDAVRAGYLLWAGWLGVHALAFSVGSMAHSYYVIAVAPPVAALAGAGAVRLWAHRRVLAVAVAATAAWAAHLAGLYPAFLPWLVPAVLACGALAAAGLLLRRAAAPVLAVVAVLVAPAAWAASTAGTRGGMAAGPTTRTYHRGAEKRGGLADYLTARRGGRPYLLAAQGSMTAGRYVLAGQPVLPIGGFSGDVPFPAPGHLAALVAEGQVRYVQLGNRGKRRSANTDWVTGHCAPVDPAAYGGATVTLYDCGPAER